MATLDEIKEQLEHANKGETPIASTTESFHLEQIEVLTNLVGSIRKISSGATSLKVEDETLMSLGAQNMLGVDEEGNRLAEEGVETLVDIQKTLLESADFDKKTELQRKRDASVSGAGGGKVYPELEALELPTAIPEGLAAILGAVVGVVIGFTKEIASQVQRLAKILLGDKKVFEAITDLGKAVQTYFKGLKTTIVTLLEENKVVKFIKTAFKPIVNFFKEFSVLGKAAGIGKLSGMFKPIMKFFNMFRAFFETFGKFFGKLFAPITVILALIEVITTAFSFMDAEAEKGGNGIQKGIAFIMGGITGFVNFFLEIGDMVKSMVSWIVEKIFGVDNPVSKFLDSFSFTEMFTAMMSWLTNFLNHDLIGGLTRAWDSVKEIFTALGKSITDAFDALVSILDPALEWISTAWGNIGKVVDVIWDTIKTAVGNILAFYAGIFTGMATIFQGVLAFFSSEESDENEDKVQAVKDLFTSVKEKFFGFFDMIGNAVQKVIEMLALPPLDDIMPDIGGFMEDVAGFFTDAIYSVKTWVKDKLMFWKSDDEEVEEAKPAKKKGGNSAVRSATAADVQVQNERKEEKRTASKLLKDSKEEKEVEVKLDKGTEQEPMIVQQMDPDALTDLDYMPQTQKAESGNVVSALNLAPAVPMVLQSAGNKPTPATGSIVGLGQETVAQGGKMQVAQRGLDDTKAANNHSSSGVNVSNMSNSTEVNNTTIQNSAMPSPMDSSDRSTSRSAPQMGLR